MYGKKGNVTGNKSERRRKQSGRIQEGEGLTACSLSDCISAREMVALVRISLQCLSKDKGENQRHRERERDNINHLRERVLIPH